jgi:hypothetical protein
MCGGAETVACIHLESTCCLERSGMFRNVQLAPEDAYTALLWWLPGEPESKASMSMRTVYHTLARCFCERKVFRFLFRCARCPSANHGLKIVSLDG